MSKFQSTHPVRGATKHLTWNDRLKIISIHAPRAGCDVTASLSWLRARHFNPRTPCGVRHRPPILPPRSAAISIHAPRAGCDGRKRPRRRWGCSISIHAPRAGCDLTLFRRQRAVFAFQSTHPVRGATLETARGGPLQFRISIHAPRAGCDGPSPGYAVCSVQISIHAPRAGCDNANDQPVDRRQCNFNPRTPCGVRRLAVIPSEYHDRFQSTHPVRGATQPMFITINMHVISIHAPRAGCDSKYC